ncbi:trypsin-like serine typically contains c-terminal pdz domain protein [Trichoderma guizhouense]|uniref:Trypsin-like serine typically contains c-terminal pdz domain protein n=1 Tax=Trichoderma guizhouense TaxID=1491466 RepID=A0A1T3CW78_9HYPO|nr:trypsin-like serine typically contains c-terminal pdz domain protein [Trichoderma guizhouense]
MSDRAKFQLSMNLMPIYDSSRTKLACIEVKLTIGGLSRGLQGGSPLDESHYFRTIIGDVENTFGNIEAYDDLGPLTISVEYELFENPFLAWKTDRPVQGDLRIQYDVVPFLQDVVSSCLEAQIDARIDNGFIGIASSFIPIPAVKESAAVDVTIEWDLSSSPKEFRSLSSFGEGNIFQRATSIKELSECVFMIGKVSSYIPTPSLDEDATRGGLRGIHWIGALPNNLEAMKEFTSNMVPRLCAFFKDESATRQIFIRKVPRGLRATQFTSEILIDYDDDSKDENDWDLVRLFNSSLIATWAHLDPEDDGTPNDWFTQGVSHIYTIYLPFRFGQRPPDYFRATLNGYLSSYFTNPFVSYPMDKIPLDSWYGKAAIAMRSCIYMIRMDCFTRRASVARNAGVLRPIDEIVADISSRRRRGERIQLKDWLKYLGDWIGEEAAKQHFNEMRSGEIMDLEDMKTAFDGIYPDEQRVLDMGFDQSSLTEEIVSGVVEHSEAAKAGLMNADEILWHSRAEYCGTHYEDKFRLIVNRQGKQTNIEFWPRSNSVVKSWISKKKQT